MRFTVGIELGFGSKNLKYIKFYIRCHDILITSRVFLQIIYIGGNPYFSNIRDCLNAHFSGNDGLPIGRYLSGPGKKRWKNIAVRWLTCLNPPEIVYYLLEDYQNRHGDLPIYNNAPNVDSRDWESDWFNLTLCWCDSQASISSLMLNTFILLCIKEFVKKNKLLLHVSEFVKVNISLNSLFLLPPAWSYLSKCTACRNSWWISFLYWWSFVWYEIQSHCTKRKWGERTHPRALW